MSDTKNPLAPKNIILVPSSYYPDGGGVQEICRNLSDQLIARGHQVSILVNRHPQSLPEEETMLGVRVKRMDFHSPRRSVTYLFSIHRTLMALVQTVTWIRKVKPDVVHVVCPSSCCIFIWFAKILCSFQLLITFQGELFMDAEQIYERSAFARWSLAKLISVSDGSTFCSSYVLQDAIKKFSIPRQNRAVIYNGVAQKENDCSVPPQLPAKFVYGLGRLVSNKGFDTLLEAFSVLSKKYSEVFLVLSGSGSASDSLRNLSERLEIADRVIFTGWQERQEVKTFFDNCMFFVMPSPVEPFGIVCLESWRSGKALIATNAGGPPEFLSDGVDAVLVPPSDLNAMATAMESLVEHRETRIRLGENGRLKVSEFYWTVIAEQYENMYSKILSDNPR